MVSSAATVHDTKTWMDPIIEFITKGTLPEDHTEATLIKRRAINHTVIEGRLYKIGISNPLLKCLVDQVARTVLQEVHDGIAGHHLGGKALTKKILRAGYYWPSMGQDAREFVKKCEECQIHRDVHNAPPRN
jgi:hypothetical protein